MIRTDLATGERRPSSGSFKPDEDGVSVYRESKLKEVGLQPAAIIKKPWNLVVGLLVGDVRAISPLGVRDDPWPAGIEEPDHPRNAAHALIVGWDELSTGQRMKRQQALAKSPSMTFIYP